MRKINCTADACWCREAGAQQHRCPWGSCPSAEDAGPHGPSIAADLSLGKRKRILQKAGDHHPRGYGLGIMPLAVCHELYKSHVQREIDVSIDFLHQLVARNDGVAQAQFDFINQ